MATLERERMQVALRTGVERATAVGVEVLAEGIRLFQVIGERFLQVLVERRVRLPAVLRGIVGRDPTVGDEPAAAVDYECVPVAGDAFDCRPGTTGGRRGRTSPDAAAVSAPAVRPPRAETRSRAVRAKAARPARRPGKAAAPAADSAPPADSAPAAPAPPKVGRRKPKAPPGPKASSRKPPPDKPPSDA
jgi:hypothetical protein